MIYRNFKRYVPEDDSKQSLIDIGVIFFKDEKGYDWYSVQQNFADDTLKIVFDDNTKVIVSASKDVSRLTPEGYSVTEVKKYPKNFLPEEDTTEFIYNEDTGAIAKRVYSLDEMSASVNKEVKSKIADIMATINPLQFAIDLEMATDEERERLKSLQKYVVLLNRVPLQETYPTGIVWPEIPTT